MTPSSKQPARILVIDDEEAMREVLETRLEGWGYEVGLAADAREARLQVETFRPHLVITDLVLPDVSGLELLQRLKAGNPHRPVLLITAHGTVELAVEAMKEGATDFFTKPLDYDKLRDTLASLARGLSDPEDRRSLGPMHGRSRAMREVFSLVQEVAGTNASALITGESGTGKELVARTIHQLSDRSEDPFIAVNAAAIPDELVESEIFGHEKGAFTGATGVRQGCFELAHRGTLFLDEIAEMPVSLQPKLLRVLEDGRVRRVGGSRELQFDVRLLAATNQSPSKALESGRLREDLYYRLNVFSILLPPLRERPEDVMPLVDHFVEMMNRRHGTSVSGAEPAAAEKLEAYRWPGNVRELRNVVERAVILAKGGPLQVANLPPSIRDPGSDSFEPVVLPVGISVAEAEKQLILKTLEMTGNNKTAAARHLGVDVKTIRNKLKSYGLA